MRNYQKSSRYIRDTYHSMHETMWDRGIVIDSSAFPHRSVFSLIFDNFYNSDPWEILKRMCCSSFFFHFIVLNVNGVIV